MSKIQIAGETTGPATTPIGLGSVLVDQATGNRYLIHGIWEDSRSFKLVRIPAGMTEQDLGRRFSVDWNAPDFTSAVYEV